MIVIIIIQKVTLGVGPSNNDKHNNNDNHHHRQRQFFGGMSFGNPKGATIGVSDAFQAGTGVMKLPIFGGGGGKHMQI